MATSLASKSVGSPDNSYTWYLQSGGTSLATGFAVALGNCTETPLFLDANGIGFRNAAGFTSSFRCPTATANQTVTIHYTGGTGEVFPELHALLAADASNSTVTPATVSGFSVTLAASSLYEFEAIFLVRSALTTTSPRFVLNGPSSETDFVSYEIEGLGASNAQYQAWGSSINNAANAPAADTTYLIRVRGACKTTGSTPTSAVTVQLFSEVGGSAVTLKAGSSMRFRKIN